MVVNEVYKINECKGKEEKDSPFRVYENEEFKNVPMNKSRGHYELIQLDKLIVVMTEKLLVVTSMMLQDAIRGLGVEDVEQADIQKRLMVLAESDFLSKHAFVSGTSKASFYAYKIGWRGIGYLRAAGIKPRLNDYLMTSDATHIKRILSVGQYVVKQGIDIDAYKMCEIVLSPSITPQIPTNKIFRPQALLQLEEGTIFVESVRQNENWKQEILDKLKRISAVMKAKNQNISIRNPKLILIAETVDHMKEIMELIDSEYFYYTIPIYYTADSLTYANPEKCLYEVKKKTIWESLFVG